MNYYLKNIFSNLLAQQGFLFWQYLYHCLGYFCLHRHD